MTNKTWSGNIIPERSTSIKADTDGSFPSVSSIDSKKSEPLTKREKKHWIDYPDSTYFRSKLIRAQSGISWDIYMPEEANSLVEHSEKNTTVKVEWYRWIIVLEMSLLIFSNSVLWITYAPRTETFNIYFGFDKSNPYYVPSLSTVMLITFPLFIYPVLYLDQYFAQRDVRPTANTVGRYGNGLKEMSLIAAFLNALGAWIRYFGGRKFWWVFVGQAISGICGVIAYGIAPKLSNVWFPFHQRNTATAIILMFALLGTSVTFVITPEAVDPDRIETTIPTYMLGEALAVSILLVIMAITFKRGPSHHSSLTITNVKYNPGNVLRELYKFTFKSRFGWLNLAYAIVTGTQITIQTLIINMVLPVFPSYGEKAVSYMSFYSTLAGIFGCLVVGPFLDRTLLYNATNWCLFLITALSYLFLNIFLELQSWLGVYISIIFYGLFSYALTPVVFQYSVVKYPHRDEMVLTGILNVTNTIVGIILVYLVSVPGLNSIVPDIVTAYFPMRWGSWLMFILNVIALLFLSKFK